MADFAKPSVFSQCEEPHDPAGDISTHPDENTIGRIISLDSDHKVVKRPVLSPRKRNLCDFCSSLILIIRRSFAECRLLIMRNMTTCIGRGSATRILCLKKSSRLRVTLALAAGALANAGVGIVC